MIRYIFNSEEEWLNARKGLFTSSEVNTLMADPTKKEIESGEVLSKGAKTYILEKVVEQIAHTEQMFITFDMQRGKELEPQAVLSFAEYLNKSVNDDDFIYTSIGGIVFFTDDENTFGGTPDIIIGNKIVEIKCPKSITHLRNLRLKDWIEFRNEYQNYYDQIQLNIHLTNSESAYFVSYDDRFNDKSLHLKVIEVPKDKERIMQLLSKIKQSVEFKNQILNELKYIAQ